MTAGQESRDQWSRRSTSRIQQKTTTNTKLKILLPLSLRGHLHQVDLCLTGSSVTILVLSVVLEELLKLPEATGKYIPRSRPCIDAILPRNQILVTGIVRPDVLVPC